MRLKYGDAIPDQRFISAESQPVANISSKVALMGIFNGSLVYELALYVLVPADVINHFARETISRL